MSLPTLEISSCLIIPTFSKQTCNKSVRWIGYGDAARYLYATCLTDLAPAGHLQLSFGYIWPNSSHFSSFAEPWRFQEAEHVFENGKPLALIRNTPLLSWLGMHLLAFTTKEKHGDKIVLTLPKARIWWLMCQFSEWFSLAPGLSHFDAVILSVALLCGRVGKGSGDLGPSPSWRTSGKLLSFTRCQLFSLSNWDKQ